jgi:hypothetical protein
VPAGGRQASQEEKNVSNSAKTPPQIFLLQNLLVILIQSAFQMERACFNSMYAVEAVKILVDMTLKLTEVAEEQKSLP